MPELMEKFEQTYRKPQVAKVRSGDTVRVHQRISEGGKERTQVFEGVVIRTTRANSLSAGLTVRRLASGVGVEKTFKMHSPTVEKIEILRRAKVRRNYLTYMRQRHGKSARMQEVGFDRTAAEVQDVPVVPAEDEKTEKVNQADTEKVNDEDKESKKDKKPEPKDSK